MKIESMTLWSLTATVWKQLAILKLVIIFSFHSFEECKWDDMGGYFIPMHLIPMYLIPIHSSLEQLSFTGI